MKIFLLGFRRLDFADSKEPDRRVQGFSLYLAQESKDVVGVLPVSNEGKRFLNMSRAKSIGIDVDWLVDRIGSFIDIEIDFGGKIIDISDYSDEKSAAV